MENLSILMKHIIADLQNLDVLMDQLARDYNFNNQFYFIMQFLEYAYSRFECFMEYKHFKYLKCQDCTKCTFIGYGSVTENIHDIIRNTNVLHDEILKIKTQMTELSVQERTYISHLLMWINYFLNEFSRITYDSGINFCDYQCFQTCL